MRKLFLTALLVAMMSTSTTFAAENFSATNTGLKIGTTENQSFVQMASNRAEATTTFQSDLNERPASVFVTIAKRFKSNIKLDDGYKYVNAKSIMAIIADGFTKGMQVTIIAEGPDAQEAVETLKEFIEAGCPEFPGR